MTEVAEQKKFKIFKVLKETFKDIKSAIDNSIIDDELDQEQEKFLQEVVYKEELKVKNANARRKSTNGGSSNYKQIPIKRQEQTRNSNIRQIDIINTSR